MYDENWTVTEVLTQLLLIDGTLLCAVFLSHREQVSTCAWQVIDEFGRQGWAEFEHPDEGSMADRLVRRLQGLRRAIEDWQKESSQ